MVGQISCRCQSEHPYEESLYGFSRTPMFVYFCYPEVLFVCFSFRKLYELSVLSLMSHLSKQNIKKYVTYLISTLLTFSPKIKKEIKYLFLFWCRILRGSVGGILTLSFMILILVLFLKYILIFVAVAAGAQTVEVTPTHATLLQGNPLRVMCKSNQPLTYCRFTIAGDGLSLAPNIPPHQGIRYSGNGLDQVIN